VCNELKIKQKSVLHLLCMQGGFFLHLYKIQKNSRFWVAQIEKLCYNTKVMIFERNIKDEQKHFDCP